MGQMKFTNAQLCVILGIMFAAIVLANIFAPGAVATVTAMATALFSALFIQRHEGEPPPPDDKKDGAQ